MVLLSYATAAASTAGSYAFSAAASYVLRGDSDATTSTSHRNTPFNSQRDNKENQIPSSTSSNPSPPISPSAKRLSRHSHSTTNSRRLPSFHEDADSFLRSHTSTKTTKPILRFQRGEGEDLVDEINSTDELYTILGVGKRAKPEEIRRGFLGRSRICHPDKLPHYPPSTTAFQRLSYAYETLSKSSSRRIYDLGGMTSFQPSQSVPDDGLADKTLNGVLQSVINEFLNGDFEMIRVFVNAFNDGSPGLSLGEDAVDNLEGAFRKAREVLLAGHRYLYLLKFSLIRIYELQLSLRSLSYFDLYGRLRITFELARVMAEVPLILDKAMKQDVGRGGGGGSTGWKRRAHEGVSGAEEEEEKESNGESIGVAEGQLERRGILGVRTRGMLVLTCRVLERAEAWAGGGSTASNAATTDELGPDYSSTSTDSKA